MTPDEFVARYPRLYHLAESGSWPSIRERGLLSTTALLDLFGVNGEMRCRIESERRPETIKIGHPVHGLAVIRDQKPLSEPALLACLTDMSPTEWYERLNSLVFFWPTEKRLQALLGARAYRGKSHTVITVDTRQLRDRYGLKVVLSPINSGATVYGGSPRGSSTFASLSDVPDVLWRERRVAEVAVEHSVADIADITLSVVDWTDGQPGQTIYAHAGDQPPGG
jgi:hypothetical protein